ncbi:extracellular solute-binding protein [Paenibacillus mesophilus]|uniref:ABC transporter substrate-binding protein n=1 Tax=Paenibacillus mesophilus TaxID=2582849 RepID=UPI00110E0B12|nr:extracellular solute-binding protein [Paenibacillus mesophilus]TMV50627.1 extracellular solute-binding protein [Paenibacillus mesophilus]
MLSKIKGKMMIVLMPMCLVSTLAGCGKGADRPAQPSANPPAGMGVQEAQKIADKPSEVTITYPATGEKTDLLIERYGNQIQKKFPNYRLKYIPRVAAEGTNYYASVLANKEPIDILIASLPTTSIFLTNLKLENDISDLIKKYNYDLSKLEPSLVDIQRKIAGGGIYGLPSTVGNIVFLYNKALFDKFGVPYPKDGMTWDDIYDLARRMTRTEDGREYKGIVFEFDQLMDRNQLSAPYFEEKTYKAMFMEDHFIRAFDNLARFYKIPGNGLPNNKYSSPINLFTDSQTAAMFMGPSGHVRAAAQKIPDWNAVSVPVFKDKPGVGFQSTPEYFYITSTSKERDAAFQVLAYIASDEFQEWMGRSLALMPGMKNTDRIMQSFGAELPGFQGKNVKSLVPPKNAAMAVPTPFTITGNTEMQKAISEYSSGNDVNTVLREAAERADKQIAATSGK